MIKLRLLRWGDYTVLSGWAHCNHKRPYNREAVELESKRRYKDGSRGQEEKRCYAAGFGDGEEGHELGNVGEL